jgi:predicted nucleotidyltransferase
MDLPIDIPTDALAAFCRQHQIRRLSLFGSVLGPDFGPTSDLDVLVELEPGHRIGLLGLAAMQRELAGLIGRDVDLRTPDDLSPYVRDDVMKTAVLQHAA